MSYPFEDLHDRQFEAIVVQILKKLLGPAAQGFAAGPDGGRDARFEGAAANFPNSAAPWVGKTIAQAKHTLAVNAHYSDPDFSGESKTAVLNAEIPRIRELVAAGAVDNYMLFSNRRLGANTRDKIARRIAEEAGLAPETVFIAGVEWLDDFLYQHPDVLRLARINPVDGPLLVESKALAEVILAIADELDAAPPPRHPTPAERVSYEDKNAINVMTPAFAKALSDRYLGYTRQIQDFLADPSNADVTERYDAVVEEFQLKIIAKREDHQTFDAVFNHLVGLLLKRDPVLARNAKLVRATLFFMYWYCDMGLTSDAAAE